MNRAVRISLVLLALVAAALLIVVAIIALRFDPDAYRPLIVDSVARATGRSLELEGELGLDVFPCCAVTLGGARLGNPEGFPAGTFAEFESASASVKLWPLLWHRTVEIGTLRIDGLKLDLARDAEGRGNWSFGADAAAATPPDTRPTNSAVTGLRMDAVEATRGGLRYRDAISGREYRASDLSIRTGVVLFHGALTVDAPEVELAVTGDTLPNGRVDLALAATQIAFAPEAGTLDVPGLVMRIDDSNITGDLAVADTGMLGFDLSIDRLDVDAYLPTERDAEPASATESPPTVIPLELIRRLKLVGNVRAGELTLFRSTLTQVESSMRADGGVLRVDPVAATLYGGQYQGTMVVDATGSQAVVALDQELYGVRVGEWLKARHDSDRVSGALTVTLKGEGRGRTTRDVLGTLAGTVDLDLADGLYRGTDFLYELRRALAVLKQRQPPTRPEREETPIDTLNLQGRLGNGVMRSDAITLEIPAVRIAGSGDLDLLKLLLDYDFKAHLVATQDSAVASELEDLEGRSVPFTVNGPASDPKIRIDLEDLLKVEAVNALQRGLRKLFGRDRN